MIDLMFRADNKDAWDAFAPTAGYVVSPIVSVDEIGPITTTPAVLDEEGNELSPAVIDNRYHVNVRLDAESPSAISGPGIEWLDPATILTPARIWAGGMNYWIP